MNSFKKKYSFCDLNTDKHVKCYKFEEIYSGSLNLIHGKFIFKSSDLKYGNVNINIIPNIIFVKDAKRVSQGIEMCAQHLFYRDIICYLYLGKYYTLLSKTIEKDTIIYVIEPSYMFYLISSFNRANLLSYRRNIQTTMSLFKDYFNISEDSVDKSRFETKTDKVFYGRTLKHDIMHKIVYVQTRLAIRLYGSITLLKSQMLFSNTINGTFIYVTRIFQSEHEYDDCIYVSGYKIKRNFYDIYIEYADRIRLKKEYIRCLGCDAFMSLIHNYFIQREKKLISGISESYKNFSNRNKK